ncbi:N-acetylmuramoyl-L-alanine amidase [Pedobacter sp. Du54]|uniref:N-acetylmuramoyl-L-alanine amidase n=1 Tax=Pedobacter anseongensis TaxID=3133439 RepID=UPI0030A71FE3
MELWIYLFQVSLCSVVLYLFYYFLLKRTSFFQANRSFLILSLIISFIVPAIDITLEKTVAIKSEQGGFETERHPIVKTDKSDDVINESSLEIESILALVYTLIASLIFLKGIFDISQLLFKARRADEKQGRLKIFYGLKGMGNCSFFNLVFIESEGLSNLQKSVVFTHERIHAEKWHSADKLFMLLCRSVLWFNPLVYLYEQELEKVHEFQADMLSARFLGTEQYAHSLVDLARKRQRIYPVHSLSTHPLKLRIAMLLAPASVYKLRWRYLLSIPLVFGFIVLFSLKIVYAVPSTTDFILVADAAHGGRDLGSTSGNANEKELTLDIANRIEQKAALAGIKIVLTRNDDSELTLKERAKSKGSLFISLHIDSAVREQRGIRILIGNKPAKIKQNEELFTTILQKQLSTGNRTLKVHKNITVSPQLYLLRQYGEPSVVLELGNLNNDSDRKLLLTSAGRDALAEDITTAVAKYKRQIQGK